jgi:hypothetical protein
MKSKIFEKSIPISFGIFCILAGSGIVYFLATQFHLWDYKPTILQTIAFFLVWVFDVYGVFFLLRWIIREIIK